ncbi:MAG: hypothetical protein Q9174_006144, partial [Haloplaca sp. 1 TL-2023]
QKVSLDAVATKQINRFVRRHQFVTEQCFEHYSTSQRRAFERDVYDYARSLKLRKQAAKVAVREARKICGEVDYDTDESRLDEDEVDVSEPRVIGLQASISSRPLALPVAFQVPADANGETTPAISQAKRKLDPAEDQGSKRRKIDEELAPQDQTTGHDNSDAIASNPLTATEAKAHGTADPIARANVEPSRDAHENHAPAGRAEHIFEPDGAAARQVNDETSPKHGSKGIISNSQGDSNNGPHDNSNGHGTAVETGRRTEEKPTQKMVTLPKTSEMLKEELWKNLERVRKLDWELDLVLEPLKNREISATGLQNIKNVMKNTKSRRHDLVRTVDKLIAADPSLGTMNSHPNAASFKTLIEDLARKRRESWNDGPNSQLDLMNQTRMRREMDKNVVQFLTALNEKKQSDADSLAGQLLRTYEDGTATVHGFGSILTTMQSCSVHGDLAFINSASIDVQKLMGLVEQSAGAKKVHKCCLGGNEEDEGDDEEDEGNDGEDEGNDGEGEGDEQEDEGGNAEDGADDDKDGNRQIKSEEGHGNHNTLTQGQHNHAEASTPLVSRQPRAPISNKSAGSDDELLRRYQTGEIDWHDGLRILGKRHSDNGQMSAAAIHLQVMLGKVSSYGEDERARGKQGEFTNLTFSMTDDSASVTAADEVVPPSNVSASSPSEQIPIEGSAHTPVLRLRGGGGPRKKRRKVQHRRQYWDDKHLDHSSSEKSPQAGPAPIQDIVKSAPHSRKEGREEDNTQIESLLSSTPIKAGGYSAESSPVSSAPSNPRTPTPIPSHRAYIPPETAVDSPLSSAPSSPQLPVTPSKIKHEDGKKDDSRPKAKGKKNQASADSDVKPSKPRKQYPKTSPYFPTPPKPPREQISCIPFPPLSSTRFGLVQESLASNPFHLLIAVIFLNKTRGAVAMPVFYTFIARFPDPASLAAAAQSEVVNYFQNLGLQNQRAKKCVALAKAWLEHPPAKGKRWRRLHYPMLGDGKDIKSNEEPVKDEEEDGRVAWE